jgi:hypothetical protein
MANQTQHIITVYFQQQVEIEINIASILVAEHWNYSEARPILTSG